MKITKQWVIDSTNHGAINKAQLELLGMRWPPRAGWMFQIVGREIPEVVAEKFVEYQNRSIRSKATDLEMPPKSLWKYCPHCGKEL